MKTCWLNRENNPECILFMAGWGMGPEPFQQMAAGPVDVFMAYDYRSLDPADLLSQLSGYDHIHLLAWSMGVWAAGRLFQQNQFRSTIAIGGTCRPIDDRYGLQEQVFDATIKNFSPAVLADFYRAMFETPEHAQRFLDTSPNRLPAELQEELIALRAACRTTPKAGDIFDKKIVTGRDRIFPARNQIRAWGRQNCETMAQPHFPFYQWASWAELLEDFSRRGAAPALISAGGIGAAPLPRKTGMDQKNLRND
jgi:biotin synthesis protein BioG